MRARSVSTVSHTVVAIGTVVHVRRAVALRLA
jgi:hypothetical protein